MKASFLAFASRWGRAFDLTLYLVFFVTMLIVAACDDLLWTRSQSWRVLELYALARASYLSGKDRES